MGIQEPVLVEKRMKDSSNDSIHRIPIRKNSRRGVHKPRALYVEIDTQEERKN